MMTLAIGLTRWWVRLYTKGLSLEMRDARRAEIESDLWEQGEDATANGSQPDETALHILFRLFLGLPSDLVWRVETGAAVRFGKDPIMKGKPWTFRRVLNLTVALVVMPIPANWIKSASAAGPAMREESTLSATVLGIGGQLCLMPVLLGVMTMFWEGLAISPGAFAWGAAEIAAGLAALAGLYLARRGPGVGVVMITVATAAMIPLAIWALPAVIVIGVVLGAMAIVRWFAPAPARALARERDRIATA